MIERLPEDVGSPLMGARQIRDFADRVLYKTAERVAGCDDWVTVGLHRDVETKDDSYRFGFGAEWDEDDDAMRYTISVQRIQPFDKEWDKQVVARLLGSSYSHAEDDDEIDTGGAVVYKSREVNEDNDDEAEEPRPKGYISLDYDYTIKIPLARSTSVIARKDASFTIYDEDKDPIDAETVHDSAKIATAISPLDLERLVRFGELALNQPEKEEEFSEITLWDLQTILDCLKNYGIASRRTKVLSSRVSKMHHVSHSEGAGLHSGTPDPS